MRRTGCEGRSPRVRYTARDFVILLGGGAVAAWPLAARAQQRMPVLGLLHYGSTQHIRTYPGSVRPA